MSEKYKHLEGAVNVNGDLTPITRRPIDKINATDWEDMSFEALSHEYTKLTNRIELANRMGRADMVNQMNKGLRYLLQIIDKKRPTEDTVTLL